MTCGRSHQRLAPAAAGVLALIVTASLTACGSNDADAQAEPRSPQVNPRYATAEAMFEHVRELWTSDPVPYREYLDLVYAETPTHERLVEGERAALPYVEFEQYVQDRFGQAINPGYMDELRPDQRVYGLSVDGRRATATAVTAAGEDMELHLVQIGDRWWVSGYTLEYVRNGDIDLEMVEIDTAVATALSDVAQRLKPRIERGEFDTIDQVREAFRLEMQRAAKEQFPPGWNVDS